MQPFQPEDGCFYFPTCLLGEKHMIKMNLLYLQMLQLIYMFIPSWDFSRATCLFTFHNYLWTNYTPRQLTVFSWNMMLVSWIRLPSGPQSLFGEAVKLQPMQPPGASTSRSFPSFRFFVGGIGVKSSKVISKISGLKAVGTLMKSRLIKWQHYLLHHRSFFKDEMLVGWKWGSPTQIYT